jgi:hypothetical protein
VKWITRVRADKLELLNKNYNNKRKYESAALVVVPLGADGGVGHAITIVGPYIFDSTQKHALKLERKSLDWCCSNDGGYARVYMAVALVF